MSRPFKYDGDLSLALISGVLFFVPVFWLIPLVVGKNVELNETLLSNINQ